MQKEWYTVAVPGHNKHDQSRNARETPVLLHYDMIMDEIKGRRYVAMDLKARVEARDLPDQFYNHPSRNGHVDGIMDLPIGLCVDGVATVKKDYCIGFFLFNVIMQKRFLLAILRKRNVCAIVDAEGGAHILPYGTTYDGH
eukprot:14808640-Heterocapsa_arctica.AAC.1